MHLHRFTLATLGAAAAVLLTVSLAVAQRIEARHDDRSRNFTSNARNCGAPRVACGSTDACRFGVCVRLEPHDEVSEREDNERATDADHSSIGLSLFTKGGLPVVPSTWSERGPELGGRLDAIVRTGESRWVVGSPGGGLWRSTNDGALWTFPHN